MVPIRFFGDYTDLIWKNSDEKAAYLKFCGGDWGLDPVVFALTDMDHAEVSSCNTCLTLISYEMNGVKSVRINLWVFPVLSVFVAFTISAFRLLFLEVLRRNWKNLFPETGPCSSHFRLIEVESMVLAVRWSGVFGVSVYDFVLTFSYFGVDLPMDEWTSACTKYVVAGFKPVIVAFRRLLSFPMFIIFFCS